VAFDGGMEVLSGDTRDRLNCHEEGITTEQRRQGAADLRLLVDAHALPSERRSLAQPWSLRNAATITDLGVGASQDVDTAGIEQQAPGVVTGQNPSARFHLQHCYLPGIPIGPATRTSGAAAMAATDVQCGV
jgi:hypothetical protein